MYVLELVQVCSAGADAYYWFCSGYGNLQHLDNTYLSPFDTPMLGSIIAFIVQVFFCHRIWKLRTNNWYIIMCGVIGAVRSVILWTGKSNLILAQVSIMQLVCGIMGGVKVRRALSSLNLG